MSRVTPPPAPRKGRHRTELERRVDAANATKRHFDGKAFSFRKQQDCARLVMFHMRQLGRPLKVAAAGSWKNAEGARAALQRLGVGSIPELLDAQLERIPFARIMVGDVLQLEAEPGVLADMGAMAIWLGHGTAYAWHEEALGPVPMLLVDQPLGVWKSL